LNNLEHLDLHDNRIAGELPMSLSQMSTLQVLNLRNNTLEGSIPSTITNLTNLRILDVSSNNLSGEIPAKLGDLVGMIDTPNTLRSVSDMFTFPIEFSDLIVNWKKSKQGLSSHSLEIYSLLDLSKNQLSGQLPASLGHLKGLKLLNISYNHLSGKIPATFGNLESLESLDLSRNRLSGSIPRTLSKLQELTTLDVSNNKLEGQIPVGGQMDTMNDPNSYANNSGLCGFQILLPCPPDPEQPQVKQPEADDSWFSWQGAGIGYSVGFFATITIILVSGCISRLPPQNRHRSHRRQRV
jgi:Leucine-rich repeat (LRR) protein